MALRRRTEPSVSRPPASRAAMRLSVASIAVRQGPMHDIGRLPLDGVAQRRAAPATGGGGVSAPNHTCLPDGLKAGVEALSGRSLGGVSVHFGSPEPARINAHAFTRGADIHLAPGQERHLPHEAWHVVQQAEGRVHPTMHVAGVGLNDDAGLEREADARGAAAAAEGARLLAGGAASRVTSPPPCAAAEACVQRVIDITDGDLEGEYDTPGGQATNTLIKDIAGKIGDDLARGWMVWVRRKVKNDNTSSYTTDELLDKLKLKFPPKDIKSKIRPNFPKSAYWLGGITREIQTGDDQSGLKPSEENLALPHRFPYKSIETSTQLFVTGREDDDDLDRWTDRMIVATEERRDLNLGNLKPKSAKARKYEDYVNGQLEGMEDARDELKKEKKSGKKLKLTDKTTQNFLKYTNSLHGNIPDYGPHKGVNIQVSDRTHLNIEEDGTMTPGSLAAGNMSPHRGKGVATTSGGEYIVTTGGYKFDHEALDKKLRALVKKRGTSETTIDEDDLEDY